MPWFALERRDGAASGIDGYESRLARMGVEAHSHCYALLAVIVVAVFFRFRFRFGFRHARSWSDGTRLRGIHLHGLALHCWGSVYIASACRGMAWDGMDSRGFLRPG